MLKKGKKAIFFFLTCLSVTAQAVSFSVERFSEESVVQYGNGGKKS